MPYTGPLDIVSDAAAAYSGRSEATDAFTNIMSYYGNSPMTSILCRGA